MEIKVLYVVKNIILDKKKNPPKPYGGIIDIVHPWKPDKDINLSAKTYDFELSKNKT